MPQFGVQQAPGVRVEERETRAPLTASQLGTAVIVGHFAKGEPGKLLQLDNPSRAERLLGGRTPESVAPDGVEDFFLESEGAGNLFGVRVTDGTEQKAHLELFSRHAGYGFRLNNVHTDSQPQKKLPILRVEAQNGGRWGGRGRLLTGKITSLSNLNTTSVDTSQSMTTDAFKGGTLRLIHHASGTEETYSITGNDSAGTIDVQGQDDVNGDFSGLTINSTDPVSFIAELTPKNISGTNARVGLSCLVKDGNRDPANEFGLVFFVNGEQVLSYDDLSMDSSSDRYAPDIINNDDANVDVVVTDLLPGGTTITADHRPANFYGQLTGVTASTVEVNPFQVQQNDEPGVIKIADVHTSPNFDSNTYRLLPVRLTFTWDNGNSRYDVTASDLAKKDMTFTEVGPEDPLGTFQVGANEQLHTTWNGGSDADPMLPQVTIDHEGSSPTDGNVFKIDVLPLDSLAAGQGKVFPDAKGGQFQSFLVENPAHDNVTVQTGDPSNVGTAATLGNVVGSKTENFDLGTASGADDPALRISVDGRKTIEVVLDDTDGQSAQTVADKINSQMQQAAPNGFGGTFPDIAFATSDGRVGLTSPGSVDRAGPASTVVLEGSNFGAGHTDVTPELGLSHGLDSNNNYTASVSGDYSITTDSNDRVKLTVDGEGPVEVQLSSGTQSASAVAGEINAQFSKNVAQDNGSNFLQFIPDSTIEFHTVSNSFYSTANLPSQGQPRGQPGTEVRFQYDSECTGGYDGLNPTASDYQNQFDLSTSPINDLIGGGWGVVQISLPGITDTVTNGLTETESDVVQQRAERYARDNSFLYHAEAKKDDKSTQAVLNFLTNRLGRSDFQSLYYPGWMKILDPDKTGTAKKDIPTVPAVMGKWAKKATQEGGYHEPAAGRDAALTRMVEQVVDLKNVDDGVLNTNGVNVIKKKGANFVIWGARTTFKDPQWKFLSKRLQMSQYERTFLDDFDDLVFQPNTSTTRASLEGSLTAFFLKEFSEGVLSGQDPGDAFVVKVDRENNPQSAIDNGEMNADIAVNITNFVETLIISIGQKGVNSSTA